MTVVPYSPWPHWTDALGNEFTDGDFVAYAYMSGRSAALQFGQVISINRYRKNGDEIIEYSGYDSNNKKRLYKPSCTVTVTPIVRIKLAGTKAVWTDRKYERDHSDPSGKRWVLTHTPQQKKTWQNHHHILRIDPIPLAAYNDY